MVRLATRVLLLFVAAFALACTDTPTATAPQLTPGEEMTLVQAESDIRWSAGCPTLGSINLLAHLLFRQDRDERGWMAERLGGLGNEVRGRRRDRVQARAHAIVEWLLARQRAGTFRGTDAQLAALINAIYCFAGIDLSIGSASNTELILPSDQPQTVTTTNGEAGVQLPANPVTEPTLLTVTQLPDTFGNAGLLDTKLDQYPGFLMITAQSEGNTPLAKPVVVGVCASGVIPQEVRDRLRLGHGKSTGFEIAQPGNADFLNCPNQVADAGAAPLWKRLASAMLPQQLHAAAMFAGGGVGGTVTEFSPFAPVDPELSFGGGVGGTVTEFTRSKMSMPSLTSPAASALGICSPIEGATGSPLRDECRPYVQLTTRLGTPFIGVPVTWSVTAGGGGVAPNPGSCGTLGASAVSSTGVTGRTGICWTLGSVGANQVTATPSLGGDAVAGVTFSPAVFTFDATANPAAGLVFVGQPAPVSPAYPPLSLTLMVVDKNGERVHASQDRIFVTINKNTFDDGRTELNPKAVDGLATATFTILTLDTGYQLAASSLFLAPPSAPALSDVFEVVASFPVTIQIVGGNGQTGLAGAPLTTAPRVRVTDRYGNIVVGAGVRWAVVSEGGGSVSSATSVTNALGEATTNWTIALGSNNLRAYLLEGSLQYTTFAANGIAP